MSLLKKPLFYIISLAIFIIILFLIILSLPFISKIDLSSLNPFKPHPGSCLILEEKYCKTVKFIDDPRLKGNMLAIYSLGRNAILFSPVDGQFVNITAGAFKKNTNQVLYYPGIVVLKKYNIGSLPEYSFSFTFYNNSATNPNNTLERGDVIGTVSDKTISFFGNYNLVVEVVKNKQKDSHILFLPGTDILKQTLSSK
jgi:hypothetical protein